MAQRLADATSQAVIQGKYKNSKDAIDALKSGVLQYKDENGNMVKVSEEDISRLENTTKTKSQDIVKTYRDSKSGADQGFFGPMGKSLATAGDQLGKFAGWAGEKFGEFISWAKKLLHFLAELVNGLVNAGVTLKMHSQTLGKLFRILVEIFGKA